MKQIVKKFLLMAGCLLIGTAAFAQVTTSSMSGRIVEENGTPIAGVTVIATHAPSGSQYYSVSDNNGSYRIFNMRAGGPYNVVFDLLGYQKIEVKDVNLPLADNFVLNATLVEEAFGLDAVIISAESSTSNMRSDRAGAMTSIDNRSINSLPTINRSVSDLVKLTPQAYNSGSGPQIGGGSYRQNFFTVDGSAFNNAFGIGQSMPASGSPISLDALEQVSISVTPFDIRQSGFIGGSFNAVTKSGSNEFSGSVYTYYYNDMLRGRRVGDNTLTLNEETNLVYGARIGGPIIKDKLFFFVNVEAEQETAPGPSRRASTASNPYTTGNDNIARPTETEMNTIKDYLMTKYGYDAGAYQGYSSESPGLKILARLDWNINRDHKLSVRYSNTQKKNPSNPSTSTSGLKDRYRLSGSRTNMTAIYFQNARYFQETNFSSIAAELNSRFGEGKYTNILRASYSHQYEPRSTGGGDFPFVDIGKDGQYFSSFGTELFSYGNLRDVTTINITDELSWSLNRHNFLAGIQFENNLTKNGFQRFGSGYFQYDSWEDFINDNPHQFAITHSMRDDFAQVFPSFKFNQLSLYFQDEIEINRNFRLSAGLRLELPMYPNLEESSEQVKNTTLKEHNGNKGIYDTSQLPSTKLMFSPRVGFNWDITGDRQFVLRGGSGLFTGRIPFVWIVAQSGDSGVLQATYTAVEGDGKVIPTFSADRNAMLKQIYPNGVTAGTANISSISLIADDIRMPQTWKTSLAFDVRLPWGMIGTIEGIYNYDINPVTIENVGLKDPTKTNISGYADNRNQWSERYDKTLKDAYLLKNADEKGYYYSITAKLEKRYDRGFSGMIAYTYSAAKSLGDGWGDQMYSAWQNASTVNGNNIQELGYASYVMPHRLIASLSYRQKATAISLFYEGGPQGRLSYTYTKNVIGDGGAANLIYVPKSQDELTFQDYTPSGWKNVYTASQQAADFWNFVNNDKYLKTRKGEYAERNGVVYPWTNQFDVKVTTDIFVTEKAGRKSYFQIGLDIRNIGNLLNKNWGHKWYFNKATLLEQVSGRSNGAAPVYKFQTNGTEVLKDQFTSNVGTSSTYMMLFSLRYIFN